MPKSKKPSEVTIAPMRLDDGKGGTLELMRWRGEPAVLVDGKFILRRSLLARELAGKTTIGHEATKCGK